MTRGTIITFQKPQAFGRAFRFAQGDQGVVEKVLPGGDVVFWSEKYAHLPFRLKSEDLGKIKETGIMSRWPTWATYQKMAHRVAQRYMQANQTDPEVEMGEFQKQVQRLWQMLRPLDFKVDREPESRGFRGLNQWVWQGPKDMTLIVSAVPRSFERVVGFPYRPTYLLAVRQMERGFRVVDKWGMKPKGIPGFEKAMRAAIPEIKAWQGDILRDTGLKTANQTDLQWGITQIEAANGILKDVSDVWGLRGRNDDQPSVMDEYPAADAAMTALRNQVSKILGKHLQALKRIRTARLMTDWTKPRSIQVFLSALTKKTRTFDDQDVEDGSVDMRRKQATAVISKEVWNPREPGEYAMVDFIVVLAWGKNEIFLLDGDSYRPLGKTPFIFMMDADPSKVALLVDKLVRAKAPKPNFGYSSPSLDDSTPNEHFTER